MLKESRYREAAQRLAKAFAANGGVRRADVIEQAIVTRQPVMNVSA